MTLDEWRIKNRLSWLLLAIRLSEQGCGPIFQNRLNRLRGGAKHTLDELRALCLLTGDEVDSFLDEVK